MIVKVNVNSAELLIPVGEGKQSIKWLSLAIQARLQENKLLRASYEDDNVIVNEIRNSDGVLINPRDCIYDHTDGSFLVVSASVSSSYHSDEFGNPVINDWSSEAFVHNKIHKKYLKSLKMWRNKVNPNEREEKESSFITLGDILNDQDNNEVFQVDWNQIKWEDWIDKPFTEEIESNLKNELRDNYDTICNLFSHYCGLGQVGQRYGMTINEYSHLIHMSKLYNLLTNQEMIVESFFKPISTRSTKPTVLMTRLHFVQSIVAVALMKGKLSTLIRNLKIILKESLLAFWNQIKSSYLIYSSKDPIMRTTLREHFQLIKPIFLSYCKINSNGESTLFLPEIMSILMKSNIVTSQQEINILTAIYQIQLNPTSQYELKDLVYIEFLEVVAKIANQNINTTNGINEAKKFRMALNLILDSHRSNQIDFNRK